MIREITPDQFITAMETPEFRARFYVENAGDEIRERIYQAGNVSRANKLTDSILLAVILKLRELDYSGDIDALTGGLTFNPDALNWTAEFSEEMAGVGNVVNDSIETGTEVVEADVLLSPNAESVIAEIIDLYNPNTPAKSNNSNSALTYCAPASNPYRPLANLSPAGKGIIKTAAISFGTVAVTFSLYKILK